MPEDITEVSIFVLYVVTGYYALEHVVDFMDKEERLLARELASSARGIEVCVWELRRRYPRFTRPAKQRTAYRRRDTHTPKASMKRPFPELETFLGTGTGVRRFRNNEHSQFPCKRSETALVARPERDKAAHIAEELEHARQLKDHQAIQEDGFSTWERPLPLPLGIYTSPAPSPEPPQAKEAMMKHDDRTNARTSNRDRSIVMVRSGKARAKGLPPRTDCAIAPAAPRLTMAPDAEARAAEDAKYLAMRPVDPTTRKAEPVLPEGIWSLDDLIEDRKMVRLGM